MQLSRSKVAVYAAQKRVGQLQKQYVVGGHDRIGEVGAMSAVWLSRLSHVSALVQARIMAGLVPCMNALALYASCDSPADFGV